jgi:hypothetical protein
MRIRLHALMRLLSAVTTITATSAPQQKPLRPISRSATGYVLVAGTTFTFQRKPAVRTKATLELHDALSDPDARLLRLSVCDYVFHYVCLDELINRVEASSKRCPLCRKELCKPRDKEPVLFP